MNGTKWCVAWRDTRLQRDMITIVAGLLLMTACGPSQVYVRTAPPVAPAEQTDVAPDSTARRLLADVQSLASTILVEARYATADNFTGAPLPGYEANRALLRREAAEALARVQRRALARGYSLKVFDGYRPVRATLAMVEWTERVGRPDLIRDGYIAARSRHNLGLAVDLTLVHSATSAELEMGTEYDTFTPAAHTANATGEAARNRALLVELMKAEGFSNYDKEWWHFTFEASPPLRFDLVVR